MPFYHFNVDDEPDSEGTELADDHMAREEAIRLIGTIIRDHPNTLIDATDMRVEVTNDLGLVLSKVLVILRSAPVMGRS